MIFMFQFDKNWMEFFFLVIAVIGVLIALSAPSAVISYIIIFLSGIIAGRLICERKDKIKFPYLIIVLGFFIGYLIGVYYGSRIVVVVLFMLGSILGYNLYEKKILKDVTY